MKITIDAKNGSREQNKLWRGMGMVSGNNSSRLLLDYKAVHPQKYWLLLELIFGRKGIGIEHLKIEMGSDVNSSSGTEPCTMRKGELSADVTRGAGFILCADAKKINPELTLDMLWWGEPLWIEEADNVFEARYSWYRENLIAAYEMFGLKFDFVSATQNERGWNPQWIKYLSSQLKNEKNCPYDFSKIKIVAGDEVCTWNQADLMLADKNLLDAIDVIGSHYTSWSTENVLKLRELGKEVWFSEGSSPMGYSTGLYKYDGNGSGLNGLNGVLDVANRIITMYPGGKMTLCEFQPVVAAYYDGVCYCHKQFISANTPWNGYYELNPGFYMTLHFSQFIKRGWAMVDSACFADGKPAGDGHALGDAHYSFLTGTDPETGDWSTVITNTTNENIDYQLELKNIDTQKNVYIYETTSWKTEDFLVRHKAFVENGKLNVTLKPCSIVTISTILADPVAEIKKLCGEDTEDSLLKLPYKDNFSYKSFDPDFIASRGGAPLYTTDEAGAFEVVYLNGKYVLQQKINESNRGKEWGASSNPVTNLGDDRWLNYSASVKVKFTASGADNYAGLALRYNLPSEGQNNGLSLLLYADGKWSFNRNGKSVESGNIDKICEWNVLNLCAIEDNVTCRINNRKLFEKTLDELGCSMQSGGRVALMSNYELCYFSDLILKPEGKLPYVKRLDNLDDCFEFLQNDLSVWNFGLMESFKQYKRTVSKGKRGCKFRLYSGSESFYITGSSKDGALVKIMIDGKIEDEAYAVKKCGNRECLIWKNNLGKGKHTAEFELLEGELQIDAVEFGVKN